MRKFQVQNRPIIYNTECLRTIERIKRKILNRTKVRFCSIFRYLTSISCTSKQYDIIRVYDALATLLCVGIYTSNRFRVRPRKDPKR